MSYDSNHAVSEDTNIILRLNAELKAAQEDISQLKTQLHQTEIERNMASDCVKADGEQISQLTRERDEARKKNETSAKAVANLGAEIARLRSRCTDDCRRCVTGEGEHNYRPSYTEALEHKLDRMQKEYQEIHALVLPNDPNDSHAELMKELHCWDRMSDESIALRVENDRLRKALEEIAEWAKDGPTIARDIATRALNQQPAQQEKTNWEVDGFGLQNPRKVEG